MSESLVSYLQDHLRAPKELHFESSSWCNGACVTCPRQGMERYQGPMKRELLVKGVDECKQFDWVLDYFHFHLNGEPLHVGVGELCWRIDYAKDNLPGSPTVCFFTNASLLTEDASERLLASKLDKIVFSVDGGTKEAFEAMRRGLRWEEVVGNIVRFMQLHREGRSHIATQTAFIPTKLNASSLPQYYKLFRGMGIDDVGGSGVNNIGGHIDSVGLRLPEQYIGGNKKSPCWRIFLDLSIQADGKAVVCCQDVRGECVIGDLNIETLKDIWDGRTMMEVRQAHLNMEQELIPFCANCDYMESFANLPRWWPQ